jgi:multiple sugar transport system permease protein
MTDDSMYTLPVALANLSLEHVQDTELMMAGSVITIFPVLLMFALLQKYYIEGIMAGGLKD